MTFVLVLLAGVVSGVVSSIPIGPTNLWLVQSVFPPAKTFAERALFVSGIILMDVLYALIALWGYYEFLQGSTLAFFLILASAFILIVMGINDLWKLRRVKSQEDDHFESSHVSYGSFILGVILGINPGFIVYWLGVATTMDSWGLSSVDLLHGLLFGLGICIADILWYALVVKLALKGSEYVSEKTLFPVRVLVAVAFIVFGCTLLSDLEMFSHTLG